MATLDDWTVIDASNNATPPDGWPENTMNYSEVNNTGRAVQGTMRRFWGDVNGSLQAAGIVNAYTVTLNETGYTAYFQGMYFACEIPITNTGNSTLNVNGIGIRSIVDDAAFAIASGALQAGGIYVFRDTGTSLQLMGALSSVISPTAQFSNSNDPDLVDTDVALNVGANNPDSAQHIEVGPRDIQSKSNNTTAALLRINERGGNIEIGSQFGLGQVDLYDSNSLAARTRLLGNGSFEVNNTVTGAGLERVLTVSDKPLDAYTVSNETRISDAVLSDSDLRVDDIPIGVYRFEASIKWRQDAGNSQGILIEFGTAGAGTGDLSHQTLIVTGGGAGFSAPIASVSELNILSSFGYNASTSGLPRQLPMWGHLTVTGNTIDLIFRFAQLVSNASGTTLLPGSHIVLTPLSNAV